MEKNDAIDETSINLCIGKIYCLKPSIDIIDLGGQYNQDDYQELEPNERGAILIEPRKAVLGFTYEKIKSPTNLKGDISERRSMGNLGIEIKGNIPPGIELDHVMFNLYNNTDKVVKIHIGDVSPMKVTFQSISSPERYGQGRTPKVTTSQEFTSGGGSEPYIRNELKYHFEFGDYVIQGKIHNIKLVVTNNTIYDISNLNIYPTEVLRNYKIEGHSKNCEFPPVRECNICKAGSKCKHQIVTTDTIFPGQNRQYEFDIIFTQPIKQKQFNFQLDIPQEYEQINAIDADSSKTLLVESKQSWLIKEFKHRLMDAILIAFFIFLIEHIPVPNWIQKCFNSGKDKIELITNKKNQDNEQPKD